MTLEIKDQNPLGYERIGKLMLKFAIPSIVSLVFNSIYNMVDQIFIGQKIGYLGNAATNVIFPLTVLGIALSIMFGDGGAAFVSLNLGKDEKEEASKGAANSIMMSSILGVALCVFVLLFLEPLCRILGATDRVISYALEYGGIIAWGLPFTMFAGCGNSLIRADGRPKLSMLSMIVGTVTNIILDPIFIFIFEWGMAGAAWATIIGQILSAVITFVCLLKMKNIHIGKSNLRLNFKVIRRVSGLGISSFITQVAIVIIVTMYNILLTKYGSVSVYGAEIPLAAHGITMKVNQVVMGICMGLASGCQPIMGFNYGAGQFERVKKTILRCIVISMSVMAVATVIYQVFPMSIIRIFGSESKLYNQFAMLSFRIFLLASILDGFHICTGIYFQATGKPVLATITSITRQVIFIIPISITFAALFGVVGVLWAGPVSDTLAFIIAFILMFREMKLLKNKAESSGKEAAQNESKDYYHQP